MGLPPLRDTDLPSTDYFCKSITSTISLDILERLTGSVRHTKNHTIVHVSLNKNLADHRKNAICQDGDIERESIKQSIFSLSKLCNFNFYSLPPILPITHSMIINKKETSFLQKSYWLLVSNQLTQVNANFTFNIAMLNLELHNTHK